MEKTRRDFLKSTISAISLTIAGVPRLFFSSGADLAWANPIATNERVLVVVELEGGNDGLNTIVPYTDKAYYALRPTLAVPEEAILKIDDKLGFHPALDRFKALYDQKLIAIVQNVGYPKPDTSHFRSQTIYYRADPNAQEREQRPGWLGKYADLKLANNGNSLSAINFGQSLSASLIADKVVPLSITSFEEYPLRTNPLFPNDRKNQLEALRQANMGNAANAELLHNQKIALQTFQNCERIESVIGAYQPSPEINYPKDLFGNQLQMAAQLIAGGVGTQIIYLKFAVSSFDTHSGQKLLHTKLLTTLGKGLEAFYQDLVRLKKADNVLLLAFSEFGRRAAENGSGGTDHGASGPMFIIGNGVKGGFYGDSPSLSDLDAAGNTKYDIDFRAVYATILNNWLQTNAVDVLGAEFENIGFLHLLHH